MAMEGMDTGLAQQQYQQFQSQGIDGIQQVITHLDSLISQIEANWKGPDATQFQGQWTGQYRGQLNNIVTALTDFNQTFSKNIQQQQQASGS